MKKLRKNIPYSDISFGPAINLLPWRENLLIQNYKNISLGTCSVLLLLTLLSGIWSLYNLNRVRQQNLLNTQLLSANQQIEQRIQTILTKTKPEQDYFTLLNHLQLQANLLPSTAQRLAWLATESSDGIVYHLLLQEKGTLRIQGTTKNQQELDNLISKLADKGMNKANIIDLQKHDQAIAFVIQIQTDETY